MFAGISVVAILLVFSVFMSRRLLPHIEHWQRAKEGPPTLCEAASDSAAPLLALSTGYVSPLSYEHWVRGVGDTAVSNQDTACPWVPSDVRFSPVMGLSPDPWSNEVYILCLPRMPEARISAFPA